MNIGMYKARILDRRSGKIRYISNVTKTETVKNRLIIYTEKLYSKTSYSYPVGSYDLIGISNMYKQRRAQL